MARLGLLPVLLLIQGLAGCAAERFDLVHIPQRAADVYPSAQAHGPLSVVADAISDPARSRQYFGVDLPSQGILPVVVVFSNYSDGRYVVRPHDVLLLKGEHIIDPLPVERVSALAKARLWRLNEATERRIDSYFEANLLRETVIGSRASHQGVLFFPVLNPEEGPDVFFRALSLFGERSLRLYAAVTDWQHNTRHHFGPFYLPEPERTATSSHF